ncbi:UNVERIFIED_CONTAM: Ferritin-2, chloroplastic [Sesamum calycinum]|uniref:Ferritin n=1 Tax=Sesamum calycinum TaxID=2727403 RepID=A0AAW2LTI7_9LAMI
MLLKTASAFGLLNSHGENLGALFSPASSPPSLLSVKNFEGRNGVVCAARHTNSKPLTGVVFEPFEEVKKELLLVPSVPQDSLARHKFADESEAAINEQIKWGFSSVSIFLQFLASFLFDNRCYLRPCSFFLFFVPFEINWNYSSVSSNLMDSLGIHVVTTALSTMSYVYHAMYAYFDRDNVALKGLAKFFKESSLEEREHAENLMEYQNKRGGKVKLQSILMPLSEFDHAEKGDALYAMELALSLEKLTNEKLLNLHAPPETMMQLTDFIESEYLAEQVESIKKISEYVAQLRRVGKGHGVWHFDQMLLVEEAVVA